MTDFFALLGQPRRPWLDPERLKEAFLARSGEAHPDRALTDETRAAANLDSSALNEAHQVLRDPRLRLRHLLFLTTGEAPSDIQSVPTHISELFFRVGRVFQPVDEVLRRRTEEEVSPMARASRMQDAMSRLAELRTLQGELEDVAGRLDVRLRELDGGWSGSPTDAQVRELRELHRDYSYILKWLGQSREKGVQLML